MKKAIVILFTILISSSAVTMAQDDLVVDESLVVKILNITDKGYISIRDLGKATKLDLNEPSSEIVSFVFLHTTRDGKVVEILNKGAEFSEQLKMRLKEMKIGTKFEIQNVVVDNASGRVQAKLARFTIKS